MLTPPLLPGIVTPRPYSGGMALELADRTQERIFADLNPAQRDAVEAVRGPVCILAGAGTGKTTTITRRIAWQVTSGELGPEQILAVAFTTKAAKELATRLNAGGAHGVRAMTFHAEALAQFRRFSPEHPEILSHKGQVLHQIVQRLPMPHRFTALRDIAGEIEWAKNRRVPARDYLTYAGARDTPLPAELMARVYVEYEKRKRRAGLIDFEDLLERTIAVLSEDPRALGAVRSRYAAFTVDEYQDVNLLQQSLLDLWVGARDDICVVGDDHQSIFGFTGASADYLLRFPARYEHATVVALTENYRSTPDVLSVANRLVPRLGGTRKELRAVRPAGAHPVIRDFDRGTDEVGWIAGECARLHASGIPYEEIAILHRINGRSEDFEEALARANIPYQVRDGSFLARPAARSFLARARRAPAGTVADVVGGIARGLGYDASGKYESGDEATRQADLERLIALASEFPGDSLEEFCADLRTRFAPDASGRGVQLMTYHRAKGLEFEAVFLPRLEEKELPHALSENDIEEERRLFYVGITRAKSTLVVSFARTREGERRAKPRPSRFLDEIRAPGTPKQGQPAASQRGSTSKTSKKNEPLIDALAASPLYEALKTWRREIATTAGLPAYVVFHDSTLAQIATQRPVSRADLRAIPGVGPLKMQKYGEELLSIVATRG